MIQIRPMHAWDLSPAEARALQLELREQVCTEDRLGQVRRVAGIDVGFEDGGRVTRAAVTLLDFPSLTLLERALVRLPTRFPYVPGLLSFRELPGVLEALARIEQAPDLVLCDAHGLAHPRRFGLACHLGLLIDTPSIGVAKSRLVGEYGPVPERKGAWTPLVLDGDQVGAVLCTRTGVSPLYVSVGHRISLETAIHYVLACTTRFRLPETTRQAHHLASVEK